MNAPQQSARLRPFRPVSFGRYTLLTPLSVGGMGEIFLARLEGPQGFEKLCVIKKILPALAQDPEFVDRFVNEARTLVKLSHGCIAQVLDMGLHEGDPYIALEYVDGKDLRKVAARARERSMPLPLTLVLYVMSRLLDALAYAHRKRDEDEKEIGLVHRDVSPQNVLISYEGEVKVIDFGLAKSSLNQARTNPSMILGKFLYMSPEQARHQKVDRRADLYAAGLCLYELVAGQNPFDHVPPHELMAQVANPTITPLQQVDPLCPRPVLEMVARALEVDPARRFQTAEEFRARVVAALLEIDPQAGPESATRYMREAFAQEYAQERKLLAGLRGVLRADAPPRPPEAPQLQNDRVTAVFHLRDVAPDADAQLALQLPPPAPPPAAAPPQDAGPPLPIHPSPLSFAPTPRATDAGPRLEDGETVPGALLDEPPRRPRFTPGPQPTRHLDTQPQVILDAMVRPEPRPVEDTQPRVVVGTLLEELPEVEPAQPEEVAAPRPPPSSAGRVLRVAVVASLGVIALVAGLLAWELWLRSGGDERSDLAAAQVLRPGDARPINPAPGQWDVPAEPEALAEPIAAPPVEEDHSDIISVLELDPVRISKEAMEPPPVEEPPAPTKEAPVPRITASEVVKEWRAVHALIARLERRLGCAHRQMEAICSRREWLRTDMKRARTASPEELVELRASVRALRTKAARVDRSR
jgi:hypothetical protein